MNKIVKKTLAAALALSLVGGGLPAITGGTDIFKSAIVAEAAGEKVALTNVNVALDDSITLKFYATKASVEAADVDSVTLTGPNGPINVTSFTADATDTYYVFSYPIYATELDENVNIQFKKSEDTVQIHHGDEDSASYSYKVNDYCDYVISDTNNEFDEKTENAANSLKNLGIAAKNYFSDSTDEITFLDNDYSSLVDFGHDIAGIEAKFSLVLDSKLSARTYIDGLTVGEQSQAVGGLTVYTAISGKGDKACFELANINPTELDGTQILYYNEDYYYLNPLFYCARAINNNTNPKAVDVAKAVYEYNKYIEKYANIIKIWDFDSDNLFSAYEFSFTPGMTWSELAGQYENVLIIGSKVGLDYDDAGYNYICDGNESAIEPSAVIDPSITYYYEFYNSMA